MRSNRVDIRPIRDDVGDRCAQVWGPRELDYAVHDMAANSASVAGEALLQNVSSIELQHPPEAKTKKRRN